SPPKNARIFTNPDHYLSLLLLHNILRLIVFILLPIWEIIIRLPCIATHKLGKRTSKLVCSLTEIT
ncbi:MAG: hypothetical protein BECKG1743D_GA0114223_106074, partial [Candidatus Kentron sp. G]